jgi:putative tributyrin esterase
MPRPFRTFEISDPAYEQEGLRHTTVKSAALQRRGDITFWLPDNGASPQALVILLHGIYGSHWSWAWKGGAHRTAARLISSGEIPPLALAMPSDGLWGDGSGYVRHASGANYERWIIEEVPAAAAMLADTLKAVPLFLCGLSMGGFGALRLAALYADRVSAASAHSSATSLTDLDAITDEDMESLGVPPEESDLLACLLARSSSLPPLRFDCGTEDVLLPQNRALHHALQRAGVPHYYKEGPGGHSWSYWSENLAASLRFFAAILTKTTVSPPLSPLPAGPGAEIF